MAKAADIIDRAYSLIGYKDPGEALSGADATYALGVLNDLLDGWNTDRLFIYSSVEVIATVSGRQVAIGPGLAINTVRPTQIPAEGSFFRVQGIDYPLEWLDDAQYQGIAMKQTTSTIPLYAYYDGGNPGLITFWPFPAVPSEFHLLVMQQLTAFPDLTTDIPLVQGYKSALQYSLAEELSPGVREVSSMLARKAAQSRRAIRITNVNVPLLSLADNPGSPLARFMAG